MDLKETIEVINFAIKNYRDVDLKVGFGLLEYYSITNISPVELAKMAYRAGFRSKAAAISVFSELQFWQQKEINVMDRLKYYHGFNGVELTKEDKLNIIEKIKVEEYPMLDGLYDRIALYYANNIEVTKESIRNKVLETYYNNNSCNQQKQNDVKVLKK